MMGMGRRRGGGPQGTGRHGGSDRRQATMAVANMVEALLWGGDGERAGQDHPAHTARLALVYVRQSTPGQVRAHAESTQRQDGLAAHAAELGWGAGCTAPSSPPPSAGRC